MDELIDAVARTMTAAPQPEAFRDEVLARLDRRRTRDRWPAMSGALAAAAVLLVVAMTAASVAIRVSRLSTPELPGVSAPVSFAGDPAAIGAPTEDASAWLALEAAAALRAWTEARPTARPSMDAAPALTAEETAWFARAIPALAEPPPLDVAAIQPTSLTRPLLVIEPMTPAPLALRPLGAGRAGGRR
jgi:hypothetical protein